MAKAIFEAFLSTRTNTPVGDEKGRADGPIESGVYASADTVESPLRRNLQGPLDLDA